MATLDTFLLLHHRLARMYHQASLTEKGDEGEHARSRLACRFSSSPRSGPSCCSFRTPLHNTSFKGLFGAENFSSRSRKRAQMLPPPPPPPPFAPCVIAELFFSTKKSKTFLLEMTQQEKGWRETGDKIPLKMWCRTGRAMRGLFLSLMLGQILPSLSSPSSLSQLSLFLLAIRLLFPIPTLKECMANEKVRNSSMKRGKSLGGGLRGCILHAPRSTAATLGRVFRFSSLPRCTVPCARCAIALYIFPHQLYRGGGGCCLYV